MTKAQKEMLAYILLDYAGTIIEFWGDRTVCEDSRVLLSQGVTAEEAAKQLSVWLSKLPGDNWDNRLPLPPVK